MRQTLQNLLATGIVVALAVPALAQPAIGPAAQSAPQSQGPFGGASAVQPGASATQVQPGGQPTVPQAGANPQGSGPYGGASAVLPQVPASPTGPNPVAPNVTGDANLSGPYGGFAAVGPPRLVTAPLESPSLIFPGAGVPMASLQQAGLVGGAFPGQTAVNGILRARPTVLTPVNPAVVNPGTANVAQASALGGVIVPRSGNVQAGGPYGGAAAVLPPQASSAAGPGVPMGVTSPQTAVNPVFTRFFTGLNAAVTPTGPVITPTP
jgi:hypothetical protein